MPKYYSRSRLPKGAWASETHPSGFLSSQPKIEEGTRLALDLPLQIQDWVISSLLRGGEAHASVFGVVIMAPKPLPCPPLAPDRLSLLEYDRRPNWWLLRAAIVEEAQGTTLYAFSPEGQPVTVRRKSKAGKKQRVQFYLRPNDPNPLAHKISEMEGIGARDVKKLFFWALAVQTLLSGRPA